jgi:hypothetical protein
MADDSLFLYILTCDPDKYIGCLLYIYMYILYHVS